MAKRLGTPYKRGKSEVIDNFTPTTATGELEGLPVCIASGKIDAVDNAADVVIGVSGAFENGKQSVIRSGLSVLVQLSGDLVIVPGTPVYIDSAAGSPTFKFTNVATDNTAVNATFAGAKEAGVDSAGNAYSHCALIDFVGGL